MEQGSGYVSGQFQQPRSHGILVSKEKERVKKINQSYSLMIIVLKLQGGTTTMFTVNNNIKINIDYYHKVTVRREFL